MIDQHRDHATRDSATLAPVYLDQVPRELDTAEADRFEQYLELAIARHARSEPRSRSSLT